MISSAIRKDGTAFEFIALLNIFSIISPFFSNLFPANVSNKQYKSSALAVFVN